MNQHVAIIYGALVCLVYNSRSNDTWGLIVGRFDQELVELHPVLIGTCIHYIIMDSERNHNMGSPMDRTPLQSEDR